MEACSSSFRGCSNARSRTLHSVSEHVPTLRNVRTVLSDDIPPFSSIIRSRLAVQPVVLSAPVAPLRPTIRVGVGARNPTRQGCVAAHPWCLTTDSTPASILRHVTHFRHIFHHGLFRVRNQLDEPVQDAVSCFSHASLRSEVLEAVDPVIGLLGVECRYENTTAIVAKRVLPGSLRSLIR